MIIIWHYRDLRLHDNAALNYASTKFSEVLPIYIHDIKREGGWPIGAMSKWWLHHSLSSLEKEYASIGNKLFLFKGNSLDIIKNVIEKLSVKEICWNIRYQPSIAKSDNEIKDDLRKLNIKVSTFETNYLISPEELKNGSGTPYLVYTPFSKAFYREIKIDKVLPKPKFIKIIPCKSEALSNLRLLPQKNWAAFDAREWEPGRKGALIKLESFASDAVSSYQGNRNALSDHGTSKLSPHLAFGEVSPKEVWHKCCDKLDSKPFLNQLLWREFGNSFLHHFPKSTDFSWKSEFEKYPWKTNLRFLKLWKRGMTGYPVVDAGMRELWQTGWMHNRARMIVGSFLVKDLHIHWVEGAKWFWDTLVDADLANNTLGWQWVAGSGPDAAPYFRIFNPILQGKKFDPDGEYVRKYIPELGNLPNEWIHNPWEAPELVLRVANVILGKTYPFPIVDHNKEKTVALEDYEQIKKYKKA